MRRPKAGRAAGVDTPHGWAGIARCWVGSCVDYGLLLRGVGLDFGLIKRWIRRGLWAGIARVLQERVQKNAKKVQKNANIFAYMENFLYLCIGFGNSSSHNNLTH